MKQSFLRIPCDLAKRDDEFMNLTNSDVAIITYILFYRYDDNYNAMANLRELLHWFGLSECTNNVNKVRKCLVKAANEYLNIYCVRSNDDLVANNIGKVTDLIRLNLKPKFVCSLLNGQYKRVTRNSIQVIVNNYNYSLIDLSCYFLLLSGGVNYGADDTIEEEIKHMESKYYSVSRLSAVLNATPKTVKKSLDRLEEIGIIIPEGRQIIKMTGGGFFSQPITYRFKYI